MNRKIFVNLAVADLPKSMTFFKSLGFQFNPQFTDATAACMVIGPDNFAMLLTHEKFGMFAPKPITDTSKSNEALICLSCESRAEVDQLVKKAVAAGAKTHKPPMDHGGAMYGHGFLDLDGHVWELMWMDPKIVQPLPIE